MENNRDIVKRLRGRIPSFECVKGCHDCCGPVTTSSEEMSRLPVKTDAEHEAALKEWNCVHLGPKGCTVYEERPLICRVFGTTAEMPCPNGRRPEVMIDLRTEYEIHDYIENTRQVLV
ncbi:YkgJ family cysteine cluster protein [Moritella sp. 24]|uniref:YkgJ family cysteine cluster protein n=1 Tax=Moritella sp. 24 TaxID=2746230 RepID=UPI001BA87A6F|nr:YkgJ family cysteine cluster protein [Moritella sp. 24]QUM77072.1 YkgJ family cysteine cluster protein [Moritella sp. 24]